jgi:SAM-dependent methyltransferase
MWRQLPLLIRLVEMGYYQRAAGLINFDISNRRILDVGCGDGFHGPVYLLLGAAQYTGCDHKLRPGSPMARDFTTWDLEDVGVAPDRLISAFKGKVRLFKGSIEQLEPTSEFDVVTMYLVTEHLMDIEGVFGWVHNHIVPGGHLLYLHHNFYCWNGHHQTPRSIEEIDISSEEQKKYLDWNHLRYKPAPHEYVACKLNRIRLDDLQALTGRFFRIERWVENPSDSKHGESRLTPEILRSFPEYTERELLTQSVHCVAVKTR